MKLAELTIKDFVDVLGSDAPAPGGGSVSALCGANGAALCAMVCRLTQGKKKYAEFDELMAEIIPQAQALYEKLILSIDKDTDAFNLVSAAFKMPKEGMVESTKVPFETMELCLQVLHLVDKMEGKFNQNAASDLGVAALNLGCAMKGAWLNVCINLGSLKDTAMAADYKARGQKMVEEGEALSQKIYQTILQSL